jgi:CubicO group peptidase (beta-lactamase class C family)
VTSSQIEENRSNMSMQSVDTLMRKAIEEKIFPGGVLLVSAKGAIIFFEAYGWAQLSSQVPMTQETIFDLASLTKPLATTLAAMSLVQHDQIGLQTPLDNVLTEFQDTDKAKVKLKHLLGFPITGRTSENWRPLRKIAAKPPCESSWYKNPSFIRSAKKSCTVTWVS